MSDFSKHLLDSIWLEPLFDLTSVGSALFSQVKELHRFRVSSTGPHTKKIENVFFFSGAHFASSTILQILADVKSIYLRIQDKDLFLVESAVLLLVSGAAESAAGNQEADDEMQVF